MKIEMGESLCVSWLKYVKGCQIVQTNWKAPVFDDEIENEKLIKQIYKVYKHAFKEQIGFNELFGKNNYLQLIRQGEVDVLGIDLNGNKNRLIAVDIAFHEDGLNYGSTLETSARILKKFLRTAFSLIAFCNCQEAEIYFVSPKINDPVLKVLEPLVQRLNDSFNSERHIDFKFQLIHNSEFDTRILNKVIIESENVSDTSELFLRSIKLLKIAKPEIFKGIKSNAFNDVKIGKLVRDTFQKLVDMNKLYQREIDNLCDEKYSNVIFGLTNNLVFLKKIIENEQNERFDIDGNARFYLEPVLIHQTKYLLSSQWFEKNKTKYLKWYKKFE